MVSGPLIELWSLAIRWWWMLAMVITLCCGAYCAGHGGTSLDAQSIEQGRASDLGQSLLGSGDEPAQAQVAKGPENSERPQSRSDSLDRIEVRVLPDIGDFAVDEQETVRRMREEVGSDAGLLKFSVPLIDERSRTALVACEFVSVGSASVDIMLLSEAPLLGLRQGEVVRLPYSQDWTWKEYKVRPKAEVKVGDRRTVVVRGFDFGIGWKRFMLHAGPVRR
jgi:hypothetical protein